ncbi:MAG: hypothetical protein AAGH87_06975 [Pseudomonadota bacterium]
MAKHLRKTALLTLGRLPKALEIARALKGAGCRVLIAEPYPTHLSSPSRHVDRCLRVPAPVYDEAAYLDAMEAIIAEEGVDLVVPVSEEAMFAAGLKARLAPQVRFFGPDLALIRALYDKAAFVERAEALGLAVPETAPLGSNAATALAARTGVVVKPVYACAGLGVAFVDQGGALPEGRAAPAVVQARLRGRARNTVSLVEAGRVLGTVAYEGTVHAHTVSVAFRRIEAPDLDEWIEVFARESDYTGFLAFDFIDDDAGKAHAIECNPRANSGVHYFDPGGMARAILGPAAGDGPGPATGPIGFKPEVLQQQFYPCLTEAQGAMLSPSRRAAIWPYLRTSKDVTWDRRDPWPFILMTFTSWRLLWRALTKGERMGEAAVADISWGGTPNAGSAGAPGP